MRDFQCGQDEPLASKALLSFAGWLVLSARWADAIHARHKLPRGAVAGNGVAMEEYGW